MATAPRTPNVIFYGAPGWVSGGTSPSNSMAGHGGSGAGRQCERNFQLDAQWIEVDVGVVALTGANARAPVGRIGARA